MMEIGYENFEKNKLFIALLKANIFQDSVSGPKICTSVFSPSIGSEFCATD